MEKGNHSTKTDTDSDSALLATEYTEPEKPEYINQACSMDTVENMHGYSVVSDMEKERSYGSGLDLESESPSCPIAQGEGCNLTD